MSRLPRLLVVWLALACSACMTLSPVQRDRAAAIAGQAQSVVDDCQRADRCAQASPLGELGGMALAESAPDKPRHYALMLDRGSDALLARISLIRGARHAIDLQTYIFDEDDAGQLVLGELLGAARRGVRVRVLIDQLAALESVASLAALSGAHANFELRVYNPVLGKAQISYPQWLLAAACCWRKLNQRMHSKLLLVDDTVGVTGGRNYQDDYYDWDVEYNFRDRDVLVAGPVAGEMKANFEAFWTSPRSVPAARLHDVGRWLLDKGVPPPPVPTYTQPQRAEAMSMAADDAGTVRARLLAQALPVASVAFLADLPEKHRGDKLPVRGDTSLGLRALIESAQEEVLLQTPYLVLSKPAQRMFEALQDRPHPPRVVVSTNSLAATDAFIVYALSHKYKRRYLRDLGFHIYEYKPFPANAPIDLASTGVAVPAGEGGGTDADADTDAVAGAGAGVDPGGATDAGATPSPRGPRRTPLMREHVATRYFGSGANERVPLRRAGVRIGLHAKSMVVDERVAVIGTHNFDPRGDRYNTESAVVIDDAAFARELAASIRRDNAPENAWVVAPRDKFPVLWGLEYSLGKLSERLPIFDLWPTRYATSYEFVPGPACPLPVPRDHPDFRGCYRPVGDFPEVALGLKGLSTRIFTAFGAGLAPIL